MVVRRVRVLGFRNLEAAEVPLGPSLTLLHGPNGAGKTNLLEALCVGLTGASCRTRTARETIAFDRPLARVEVEVSAATGRHLHLSSLTRGGDRRHGCDGKAIEPGAPAAAPPLGIFLPDHLSLVKGPPGERRTALDAFAAGLWPAHGSARRDYGRALAQRNALLGRVRAGAADAGSLGAWDQEVASTGIELIRGRRRAVELLAPHFSALAAELGLPGAGEVVYRPRSAARTTEELAAELAERRGSDLARGHTGHGPHLDDMRLSLAGRDLRRYGSQGEQRSALLALLLAQREVLTAEGRPPSLLLLDDVMSELDPERRERLCERLVGGGGQAVITATEPEAVPGRFPREEVRIEAGRVVPALRVAAAA